MPLHDWTRVPAGLFHHFHQDWTVELARTLNRGGLPDGLSVLVEQRAASREPDVLAIERWGQSAHSDWENSGPVVAEVPQTKMIRRTSHQFYTQRANRVVVRHHLGKVVAIIEIVSPSNKDSRSALRDFVDKTVEFIHQGIHVLIVDLFPPTTRDPSGLHKAIWDEFEEQDFTLAPAQDRLLVSYKAAGETTAYIEPLAVGDCLPAMPLFLSDRLHLQIPLEPTYQTTWSCLPSELRAAVESGELPRG